jgi:hypothetical protein
LAKTLPTQAQGSGHRQKEAPGLSEPALRPPNSPLDKKERGIHRVFMAGLPKQMVNGEWSLCRTSSNPLKLVAAFTAMA